MAITEALRLLITADSAGAVKGIEQVGRTADRELSRSERQLDRWGNRLTTVGAGMLAFGAVAAAGLHSAAQSAGELEQAVGGTEAVFKDASGIIDDYAGRAAEAAGLSENEFRLATTAIGGNLKRMGFDVDEAASKSVELTQVAADLAATYGGTTAEAVQALGAAFRGEADPAERFNLDLKVSKVNAEAVALGLATSTAAVDDNARAQALLSLITKQSADAQGQFGRESDTLAGRQQILAAEFENLKAEIGEGVVPAMETLFGVARGGIGAFSGLNDATGGALGKIATIGTVATIGLGGLSLLVGQAIKMRDTFGQLRTGASALSGKLGGLGRAAGIAAGVAGVAGLALAVDQMQKAARTADVERLTRDFLATGDASAILEGAIDGDYQATLRFVEALGTLGSTNVEAAERLLDQAEAAGASEEAIDAARGALERKREADAQGQVDADAYTEATDAQAGALEGAAGAADDATSSLQEYSDQLKALTDPVFAAMDAVNGVRDAQVGLADAERGVLEAQVALDDAIRTHGATSAEAAEATLGLEDAQRNLEDAQWATVTSAAEADSALAGLKDAVDNGDVSVDLFKDTLARWVAQGFLTQAQADAAAASVAGLAGEAEDANKKRVSIPVAAPGSPEARDRLRAVKEEAYAIPSSTNTHVSTSGVQTAIGELDALARSINRASGGRIRVSVGGGGGLTLHEGGYVPGPRGQEVAAILQAGERVLSLDEVDAMSRGIPASSIAGGGGGGGGHTFVFNNHGPIASESQAERWVIGALNRAAEHGHQINVRGRRL